MYFFVSRYFEPFGTHATSNFSLYMYIYSHPVGETEVGFSCKKIENPKIGYICFFVLPYFEPFGSHTISNFSIYRYIYIITVVLRLS